MLRVGCVIFLEAFPVPGHSGHFRPSIILMSKHKKKIRLIIRIIVLFTGIKIADCMNVRNES